MITNTTAVAYIHFGSATGPSATLSSYVIHIPAQYTAGSRTGASIAWLRPTHRARAWF